MEVKDKVKGRFLLDVVVRWNDHPRAAKIRCCCLRGILGGGMALGDDVGVTVNNPSHCVDGGKQLELIVSY